MYGQTEDQEKQKKKIIIGALIMGVIIIVLIGILINAITSKNKAKLANGGQDTTAVIREDEKKDPTKIEENTKTDEEDKNPEDSKLDPVANEKDDASTVTPKSDVKEETTVTTTTTTTTTGSNLPSTGPTGALGLALLAGTATSYAFSRKKKLS